MIPQFSCGEEVKKAVASDAKRSQDGQQAARQNIDASEDFVVDEVDPAEFFDPEEFGLQRRATKLLRP